MKHPNETGHIQHYKVTLCDTVKAHVKARILRFMANCYGFYWMLRYRR
jgi:hypothetical protein